MGQQQLLLLVLGIVIVGLAVVVGIQAFGENQKKSNADALTNDAIRIASDAQAWNLKPTAFGGGNGTFTGLDFEDLGYTTGGSFQTRDVDDTGYTNLNGVYTIRNVAAGSFEITACHPTQGNLVEVTVSGTSANEIATTLTNFSEVEASGGNAAVNCPGLGG